MVKTIFNLLKSKLKKEKIEEKKEKPKDVRLKVRKSSLKRFWENAIINFVVKTCN